MKLLGTNPAPACPVYTALVADFLEVSGLELPSAHTILFIAADARQTPSAVISEAAGRLLTSGLTWICAWGSDCERVHDLFDEEYVALEVLGDNQPLMSTWHDDEPLEEAFWFFLNCPFPADCEIDTTSYVAVFVGRPDWLALVEQAAADIAAFNARMSEKAEEPGMD